MRSRAVQGYVRVENGEFIIICFFKQQFLIIIGFIRKNIKHFLISAWKNRSGAKNAAILTAMVPVPSMSDSKNKLGIRLPMAAFKECNFSAKIL